MERGPSLKVLCLSPFFAPLANAEAFCGGKVALYLLDAGVNLTVFDVDYAGHPKFSRDVSSLWAPLQRITSSFTPTGQRSKLLSTPLGLRYQTVEWSRWISATVATARNRHRAAPFDVVYSRGLPNVAHVAAYWVTRAINRPWVANFNDPWDLEGAHLLPQDRDKRKRTFATRVSDMWLRRVMHSADVLTFPCARLRDYHLRLASPGGACRVIPHIGHGVEATAPTGTFKLVHAGNLGAGESTRRNTTASLLRGIRLFLDRRTEAATRFRLVLVGPEDRPTLALAKDSNLEANIICTGRVSYVESLRHMANATVCLLVEGNMPEGIYLPSKFPDYIHAARPVIALSPSIGTIADLLPAVGVTRVPVDDPVMIERVISQHYDAFAAGRMAGLAPGDELRRLYDGTRIGAALRNVFSETVGGRHERAAGFAPMQFP